MKSHLSVTRIRVVSTHVSVSERTFSGTENLSRSDVNACTVASHNHLRTVPTRRRWLSRRKFGEVCGGTAPMYTTYTSLLSPWPRPAAPPLAAAAIKAKKQSGNHMIYLRS